MWKRISIILSIIVLGISVFAIANIVQDCQEPYIKIKPEQVSNYIDSKVQISLDINQYLGDWAKPYFPTLNFSEYDVYYSDQDIYVIVKKGQKLSGKSLVCGRVTKFSDKVAIVVDVAVLS